MTKFDELLSRPLPSALNDDTYMEGTGCKNCATEGGSGCSKEGCAKEGGAGCASEGGMKGDPNCDDCGGDGCPECYPKGDPDCDDCGGVGCPECDPADIAANKVCDPSDPTCNPATQAMKRGSMIDATPVPAADVSDVELTPDESRRVDDVLNTVATPLLLQSELSEGEMKEFVESADSDIAIAEGLITERTIVRFDKHARKAQLMEVAVAACAREKKDPLYKKLQTVYKMERIIKAKLRVKYNAPAQRKVKEYLARAKKSKSGIISKIVNKITKK